MGISYTEMENFYNFYKKCKDPTDMW